MMKYIAVAYEWFLVPAEVEDYDIALCVGTAHNLDEEIQSAAPDSSGLTTNSRIYHAKLPQRVNPAPLDDISGTLGLLWRISDTQSEVKASAFERLLSDAIMWAIASIGIGNQESFSLVIQGPMIPKLRGRLLYRGIRSDTPIYVITYQPDWLRRIESTSEAGQSPEIVEQEHRPRVGQPYPPEGVDHSSRTWMAWSGNGHPYHFEVISNTWDPSSDTNWLGRRTEEVRQFVSEKNLSCTSEDYSVPLPKLLYSARILVKGEIEREKDYIFIKQRIEEHNAAKTDLRRDSKLADVVLGVYPLADPDAQQELFLDAASEPYYPIPNTFYEDFCKWAARSENRAALKNAKRGPGK